MRLNFYTGLIAAVLAATDAGVAVMLSNDVETEALA